jgi:type IV secretory pathway VirD2 relaxase
MTSDGDFTPKLGRIRSLGSKRGRKYLHQVLRAISSAGGRRGLKKRSFTGSRIGRGAGVGRVLAARDKYAAFRQRRVIIKSRIVRTRGKGLRAAQVHLRYIQRDGVTREGAPGELYTATSDEADAKAFVDRSQNDRHQFRFIVSPEDGAAYDDLKLFIRRFMDQMEKDLATKLDWVAVDHFNTGHPHTHIVLRGADDQGKDLIIARDYMSQGMRERASEIVSLDLGPRSDLEIERRQREEIDQDRFTTIDRRLLREVDSDGVVSSPSAGLTTHEQTIRAGRLQKLGRMGLAEEVAPGVWRLDQGLEKTLRDLAMRGDIIKTMHRELSSQGLARSSGDYVIYDPKAPPTRPLVGQVVARGLSDEINDRHYLIVDGADGYSHYVDIGLGSEMDPTPLGSIVTVTPKATGPRDVDRTVLEVANASRGRYAVDLHLRHDCTATASFAETHIRRLEAIRKETGALERKPDGTWIITPDHLDKASAYEQRRAQVRPVAVAMLSTIGLEAQVSAIGATWLDRELVSSNPTSLRDAAFGKKVSDALGRRQQWLLDQGLATMKGKRVVYGFDLLAALRQRELVRVGDQLSKELGLRFNDTGDARQVSGIYRRSIDLVSGRFAVIEGTQKDFALVPWRPVLERGLGQHVSGMVRGESISWTLGKGREGPAR